MESGRLVPRSEVERREKYFDQLQEGTFARMIRDCLHNDSSMRPTAEELNTLLEEMKGEIEGPDGEIAKLDAVRYVKAGVREATSNQQRMRDGEIYHLQYQYEVCKVL